MGTASSAILQRFVLNRYMVLVQAPYTLHPTLWNPDPKFWTQMLCCRWCLHSAL